MADEILAITKAVEILDEVYKVGHEVAALVPNSNRSSEIYAIGSGSKSGIVNQQSLFMAQYQLLNNTFGIEPQNFKDWCKTFEECFPTIIKTNQNIDAPGNGVKPWMQPVENRPRIRINNISPQSKDIPTYVYVEFEPERNNPSEVYFLAGTITQVVQMIWNIWNTRQIFQRQEATLVVGHPIDQYMQMKPHEGITITIICTNYQYPPFYKSPDRQDFKKVQINVPFVDRTKISYTTIRNVAGGNTGLDWGNYRAIAHVADNVGYYAGTRNMPQVWGRGQSYEQAKNNVKQFLTISKGIVATINEGREDSSELLNPDAKYEPPAKIYPAYFWISNGALVGNNYKKSRDRHLAKYATKKNKFDLWPSTAPPDFEARIAELFQYESQSPA